LDYGRVIGRISDFIGVLTIYFLFIKFIDKIAIKNSVFFPGCFRVCLQFLDDDIYPEGLIGDPNIKRLQENVSRRIVIEFPSTYQTFVEKERFWELPLTGLLGWMKSEVLSTDSENSIYFLAMTWIICEQKERSSFLSTLLSEIKFHHMDSHYIIDTVPHHITLLESTEAKSVLNQWLEKAKEYHMCPERYLYKFPSLIQGHRQPRDKPSKTSMIKCIFRDYLQWVLTKKYYAQPVLLRGYEIYYFLQLTSTNPKDISTWQLAGFIRCTSDFLPSKFYLPVTFTVAVKLANNTDRIFRSSVQIFDDSEKALGCVLMVPGESWAEVLQGNSLVISNDSTISIVITMEFIEPHDPGKKEN